MILIRNVIDIRLLLLYVFFSICNFSFEPHSEYHWQVPVPKEVRLVSPSELQQAVTHEDNEASRPPTYWDGGEEGGEEEGSADCVTPVHFAAGDQVA